MCVCGAEINLLTQKLKRFGSPVYVAEDLGLVAYIQNDYKFMIFGKTTRACVYRIADLRAYNYEERIENNSGDSKPQKNPLSAWHSSTPKE